MANLPDPTAGQCAELSCGDCPGSVRSVSEECPGKGVDDTVILAADV